MIDALHSVLKPSHFSPLSGNFITKLIVIFELKLAKKTGKNLFTEHDATQLQLRNVNSF